MHKIAYATVEQSRQLMALPPWQEWIQERGLEIGDWVVVNEFPIGFDVSSDTPVLVLWSTETVTVNGPRVEDRTTQVHTIYVEHPCVKTADCTFLPSITDLLEYLEDMGYKNHISIEKRDGQKEWSTSDGRGGSVRKSASDLLEALVLCIEQIEETKAVKASLGTR